MDKITLNIECSRCPRVESTEISLEQAIALANEKKNGTKKPDALELKIDGVVVATYEKMCSTCRNVVMNLLDGVSRKAEKVSALRTKKAKEKGSTPLPPAPKPMKSTAAAQASVLPAARR
jgi:hypothetical protein